MTTLRESTDAKLDRLLAFARAHPAAYERRVLLFALLGYAYLVGILLLIVALMVGLALFLYGWAQAGALAALFTGVWIALITLGFTVLNAFTFTAPAPKGVLLDRVDSPELISLIEELRLQLHTAAIDEVLLTWEPGAACQQRVRFGPFGPTRRYLLLGLPALIAATPVELRAILAHEIGHLSTTNGRATAWVNGVRETWLRLLLALHEKRSLTTGLFARIFGWYMSPFQRYSFALARQQETSADQAAAEICGAPNLADALVRLAMLGRAIGRDVGLTVGMASFEGLAPAARTRELMRSQQDLAVSRRDLNAVLADDLDMDDAHPPLGARLASLGTEPRVPAPATTTAAGLYLGRRLDELCARVDELWRAESPLAKLVANSGTTIRQEIATATEELARLETSAIAQSNIEDLRRRAKLTEWLRGANAALPIYDALAARDDPAGLAGAGRIRLATGDSSGLDLIDRAIALDRSTGALAASEARDFLVAEGRTEDAAKYGEILREEGAEAAATYAVRAQIRSDDEIAAHDLAPDVVAAIAETLSRVKPVARAYLVRKVIPESPGPGPLFLALVYRTSWFIGTDQADANTLTARISEAITHLVPDVTVVVANGWAGTRKVEELAGAIVYRAAPTSWSRSVLPIWGRRAQTLVLVLAVPYVLMYGYLVMNLEPQLNKVAAPIVMAPLVVILVLLYWGRRADDARRRIAALAGVAGLIGMLTGAFITEGEWTFALIPLLALGLFRPPANAPRVRAALIVGVALLSGLGLRLFAHVVLVG